MARAAIQAVEGLEPTRVWAGHALQPKAPPSSIGMTPSGEPTRTPGSMSAASSWQCQSSQGTRIRAPPLKFEPKAQ
eukprot:12898125-Prorocentrum_lima.AAC.1